jgi:ParB-like chromosome segregation protein Spo0J
VLIAIGCIAIPAVRRALNEEGVARLVESIGQSGLLQPILVRLDPNREGGFVLIAGRHRLEAMRRLDRPEIECLVADSDDPQSELIEIDENLCRSNLTAAEEAIALARRKELYEAQHGKAKARGASAANRAMGNASAILAPAFTSDTAAVSGRSPRAIQRSVSRSRRLGEDLLRRLQGTALDSGAEIDALAELSESKRADLVERAANGLKVSAVAELAARAREKRQGGERPRTQAKATFTELKIAWKTAEIPVRRRFVAWLRENQTEFLT